MRILIVFQFLAISLVGSAQQNDSVGAHFGNSFKTINVGQQATAKSWVIKNHVTVSCFGTLNMIENLIADLEDKECEALLNRDTAVLKTLWLHDFTQNESQSDIVTSENPVPYYVSLKRQIEKITIIEDVVYTSGTEYSQLLNSGGKLNDPTTLLFTHMWIRRIGEWKLATKN